MLASFTGEGVYYAMLSGSVFAQTYPDLGEYEKKMRNIQTYLSNQLKLMRIPLKYRILRQAAFTLLPKLMGLSIRKAILKDPYIE